MQDSIAVSVFVVILLVSLTNTETSRLVYLLQKLFWCLSGVVGHAIEKQVVPFVHLISIDDYDHNSHYDIDLNNHYDDHHDHLKLIELLLHGLHLHHHLMHHLLAA